MGLYDRDYVRDEPQGSFFGGNRSMVTNIILVNVGIFLLDLVFFGRHLNAYLALHADLFTHPWNVWQLLTYGFAHEAGRPGTPIVLGDFAHVGFNMFGLWLFGRDVETIYGRKEFLRIYLSLIVLCGLSWVIFQNVLMLSGRLANAGVVIGASGAVLGIMVLYVTHYPHRVFYFWGVLPVPVWVLCLLYLLQDLAGFGGAWKAMASTWPTRFIFPGRYWPSSIAAPAGIRGADSAPLDRWLALSEHLPAQGPSAAGGRREGSQPQGRESQPPRR